MARKKKARLTLKKKIVKKSDKQVPGGLSERKFAALSQEYGSFIRELKLGHGDDSMTNLHAQKRTLITKSVYTIREMCMPHYLCLLI